MLITVGLILVILVAVSQVQRYKKKKEAVERQCRINKEVNDINAKIKDLEKLIWQSFGQVSANADSQQYEKLRKQVDELENQRYQLTGEPTTKHIALGVSDIAKENWQRKHGIVVKKDREPSAKYKNTEKQRNVPWFAVGVALSEAKHTQDKLRKQNRELKKAIEKINKMK